MFTKPQKQLLGLISLIMISSVFFIGCGTTTPPAPPPLDKTTVLKDAAVNYFSNIPESYFLTDAPSLKAKLAEPGKIYLIDLRDAKDFAAGHIPGAVNIPFQDLGKKFDTVPRDKIIEIYGYPGEKSGEALSLIKINGWFVQLLEGGFPAWEKAKFPVEK